VSGWRGGIIRRLSRRADECVLPVSAAPRTQRALAATGLGRWRPYVDEAAQEGHHAGNDSAYDGEPYAYVGTDIVDLTALRFVEMIGVDRD
jgi:hypothetical protein